MTFSGFQVSIADFRSVIKHGNSVKPNLSLHNTKVAILLALLEAYGNYHGYGIKVNAKTVLLRVTYTIIKTA